MIDFVVDLIEECVDLVVLKFLNQFSNDVCACFTTERGHPGIRKSMFTSFSIVCS